MPVEGPAPPSARWCGGRGDAKNVAEGRGKVEAGEQRARSASCPDRSAGRRLRRGLEASPACEASARAHVMPLECVCPGAAAAISTVARTTGPVLHELTSVYNVVTRTRSGRIERQAQTCRGSDARSAAASASGKSAVSGFWSTAARAPTWRALCQAFLSSCGDSDSCFNVSRFSVSSTLAPAGATLVSRPSLARPVCNTVESRDPARDTSREDGQRERAREREEERKKEGQRRVTDSVRASILHVRASEGHEDLRQQAHEVARDKSTRRRSACAE